MLLKYLLTKLNMGNAGSRDENNVELLNASFLWKIKNYSKLPEGKWVASPHFTISDLSYHLELHKDDDLKIRLTAVQTYSEALKFRYKVHLLDQLGHEHHTKEKEITVKKASDDEVILEVKGEDLKKGKGKRSLLPGDSVTINFKMAALNHGEPSGEDSGAFLERLSSDLGQFLEDKTNTDTILKINNKQFPVHRAVLSARSKVFKAMFLHNTTESSSGVVNIKDIDENILEEALYYIYTGKVSRLNADTARALYMVADKYSLEELKQECIKSIISSLTVDNVCKAALLSDFFEIEPLKNAIIKLVQENLDKVLKSDHWGTFALEKPLIANSILSDTLLASQM